MFVFREILIILTTYKERKFNKQNKQNKQKLTSFYYFNWWFNRTKQTNKRLKSDKNIPVYWINWEKLTNYILETQVESLHHWVRYNIFVSRILCRWTYMTNFTFFIHKSIASYLYHHCVGKTTAHQIFCLNYEVNACDYRSKLKLWFT